MIAQLTVIAPRRAADQFVLMDKTDYLIGRADDNDVVIKEPSVSRQHARLSNQDTLWVMSDLNSMNGLRSNGMTQHSCWLEDGSVVVVGNVPVLFSAISAQQLAQEQQFNSWRYQQALQLGTAQGSSSIAELNSLLAEALTLCRMERAAILLGDDLSSVKLHTSLGVSSRQKNAEGFFGSVGALQSVLTSRTALVVNDISQHQALSQRASTSIKHLSAVACLPLLYQGSLLGLFYVDSQQGSKYLSAFDMELLQTIVSNLTLLLFSDRLTEQLQKISLNIRQFN